MTVPVHKPQHPTLHLNRSNTPSRPRHVHGDVAATAEDTDVGLATRPKAD